MKAKKIITLALATAMLSTAAVSVAAATLTETSPRGNTEVTAHIDGLIPDPGDVTYIISIPDVVDFGLLTYPTDTTENHYKDVTYDVSLDEFTGTTADKKIAVFVRDQHAQVDGDQTFKIANKDDSSKTFVYDVYTKSGDALTEATKAVNYNTMTLKIGYPFTEFTDDQVGETITGTLRINQNQLADYNIQDIIGEYSGYMLFTSYLTDK